MSISYNKMTEVVFLVQEGGEAPRPATEEDFLRAGFVPASSKGAQPTPFDEPKESPKSKKPAPEANDRLRVISLPDLLGKLLDDAEEDLKKVGKFANNGSFELIFGSLPPRPPLMDDGYGDSALTEFLSLAALAEKLFADVVGKGEPSSPNPRLTPEEEEEVIRKAEEAFKNVEDDLADMDANSDNADTAKEEPASKKSPEESFDIGDILSSGINHLSRFAHGASAEELRKLAKDMRGGFNPKDAPEEDK